MISSTYGDKVDESIADTRQEESMMQQRNVAVAVAVAEDSLLICLKIYEQVRD